MVSPHSQPLEHFSRNFYSQNGEDGVIDFLISQLAVSVYDNYCVDVGAWDGTYLSNVRHQIDQGRRALLIEADPSRADKARENFSTNSNVVVISRYIDETTPLGLILDEFEIGKQFLLLSVDIDGSDLEVFETLRDFRPCIVVIEFNPTIPNHIAFRNPRGRRIGSSAKAIHESAIARGYELVHVTQTNLLYVNPELFSAEEIHFLTIPEALNDSNTIRAIWVGYDGSLHIDGPDFVSFPWHGLTRSARRLELPRAIQQFPDELDSFGRVVFKWCWLRQYWKIALYNKVQKLRRKVSGCLSSSFLA